MTDLRDFKSNTLIEKKASDKQVKKQMKKEKKSESDTKDFAKATQVFSTDLIENKVQVSTMSQTDATQMQGKVQQVSVTHVESKSPEFKKYECFYCGTSIVNKIFLDYHRTNCHIRYDNIMHSFRKLSEDPKFSCKV